METASILYVTAGLVHPSRKAQVRLRERIAEIAGVPVVEHRGLRVLRELDALQWPVCVAYFHRKADEPSLVSGLARYVESGGRLLAVHGVSASFKGNARFARLLGGVFAGHGPVGVLDIEWWRPNGQDVRRFTMADEPYEHVFSGDVQDVARWKAAAPRVDGALEGTCAWVREEGKGRVAYLALGHSAASFDVPGVRDLLSTLLAWLVERDDL